MRSNTGTSKTACTRPPWRAGMRTRRCAPIATTHMSSTGSPLWGQARLLPAARVAVPQTCARCHSAIYDTYKTSVHGAALTGEGNLDVPTCIDCHGVHNIQNPTTARFRNETPQLCAKCHTDKALMGRYGISTNVLATYVSDFHGTTVTLFEQVSPDTPTNKPVCTDCHGVHDISRVDDPATGVAIKANLLLKCQRCHPGVTSANFTDAWMSHYVASPTRFALVYYVNLFYRIFIPVVIGGMLLFVLTDIIRRRLDGKKGGGTNGTRQVDPDADSRVHALQPLDQGAACGDAAIVHHAGPDGSGSEIRPQSGVGFRCAPVGGHREIRDPHITSLRLC